MRLVELTGAYLRGRSEIDYIYRHTHTCTNTYNLIGKQKFVLKKKKSTAGLQYGEFLDVYALKDQQNYEKCSL